MHYLSSEKSLLGNTPYTSDTSSSFVLIEAVPSSVGLADKLRNQVEIIRQQKRVREIDIE